LKSEKSKALHFETSLKLKPNRFFAYRRNQKKGEASFAFKLFDRFPDKAPEEEKQDYSDTGKKGIKSMMPNCRQHLETAKYEVDLHIEKLTPIGKLSNFEILTIQLNTFENT
jgi:hypothetical protein